MKFILLPDSSPIVSIRFVYRAGSIWDRFDKPGTAHLLAQLLAGGGTSHRSFKQILDALFPLASSIEVSADKEMICFATHSHADHIETVYALFRERILDPGWVEADFERVREDVKNFLTVTLRGENDEELAKEALYLEIFQGHPYGTHSAGTVTALDQITIDDLRSFYHRHLVSDNLTVALGGSFPSDLPERIRQDFETPERPAPGPMPVIKPEEVERNTALLIEKPARSVAISFGFPIQLTRKDQHEFAALLLATSCLGEHRQSSGRLFQSMRQIRGLNYGDYAYLEYFPDGMYSLEPPVNLMRSQQIFQIWIRPVERDQAHFALRLALHELEKFVRDGLTEEEFNRSRSFLVKYLRLMMKTKSAELGYLIDSDFHGIPPYADHLDEQLSVLTAPAVNRIVQKHLRWDRIKFVMAGQGMNELKERLLANMPSPMEYNSPKPDWVLAEDRIVEVRPIEFQPDAIRVVPVEEMFA